MPGMIGGLTGWPVANATGPGNPTPTPRTSAAPRPISASSLSNADSSHASTVSGPSAMAMSRVVWGSTCPPRSVTPTREWVAPRSPESTTPAPWLKASIVGGRPPVDWLSPRATSRRWGDQGIDALSDGRAGQAGQRREVGPGRGLAAPDELQAGAHAPPGRVRWAGGDGAHAGQ